MSEVKKTSTKVKSSTTTGGKQKAKKATTPKTKRKLPAALAKKLKPDEVLVAIAGSGSKSRAEFTKAIWVYIKKHGLQDKSDGRVIVASKDAALKKLLGKDKAGLGDVAKAISKHTSD